MECEGTLTAWNYCYYTSESEPSGTFSAHFGVWRPSGYGYDLIGSYHNSTLVYDELVYDGSEVAPAVVCVTEETDQEASISVLRGDVVGAFLPDVGRIPILGIDPGLQMLLRLEFNTTKNRALHLYATISEDGDDGRTPRPPRTRGGRGLSQGAVAGIVMVVLLGVAITVGIIAVLTVVFCWKRHQQYNIVSGHSPSHGGSIKSSGERSALHGGEKTCYPNFFHKMELLIHQEAERRERLGSEFVL